MMSKNPEKTMTILTKEGPDKWTPWINAKELNSYDDPVGAAVYLIEALQAALNEM